MSNDVYRFEFYRRPKVKSDLCGHSVQAARTCPLRQALPDTALGIDVVGGVTHALAHAKAIGATLVFAKLDRLTRNVDLLRALVASGVDLVFCDLPTSLQGLWAASCSRRWPQSPNWRPGSISERTKAALAAAKARGVKLGNPNGARALRGKQTGNAEAVAKIKAKPFSALRASFMPVPARLLLRYRQRPKMLIRQACGARRLFAFDAARSGCSRSPAMTIAQ